MLLVGSSAWGQNCPPIDREMQQRAQQQCLESGGAWARHGVIDHLCGVYSCAERTKDGGKPCRYRADCEHLCITDAPARIGAEAPGKCTAVKTSFGCFTQVDGGRIVGRVCIE